MEQPMQGFQPKPPAGGRARGRNRGQEINDSSSGVDAPTKPSTGWGDAKIPAGRQRVTETSTDNFNQEEVNAGKSKHDEADDNDTIPIIPDLEDEAEEEVSVTVADAPLMVKQLPTDLEADQTFRLPPEPVEGVSLGLLYKELSPAERIIDPDIEWDQDLLLAKLKTEMHNDADRKEKQLASVNAAE